VTTYTELFSPPENISRKFYRNINPSGMTTGTITVPPGAKCLIISSVGAGGWALNNPRLGGGAAFARTKLNDLLSTDTFTYQIGNPKFSQDVGNSQGDTTVTRVLSATMINKAARGTGTANGDGLGIPGLAADCIGDIKRDGLVGNISLKQAGMSGGDLNDPHTYGFGGRGARVGRYPSAGPGGGGIGRAVYDGAGNQKTFFPGGGLLCFDFWTKDPGWIL
jgi:hypothetical protein